MFEESSKVVDKIVFKRHHLRAEKVSSAGKGEMLIYLDGDPKDSLYEWRGIWYHRVGTNGPEEGEPSIGGAAEEALNWWLNREGLEVYAGN
jgi:hypothetical protein